jgi:hypothetical protein
MGNGQAMNLYFRIRENGATVFRLDVENRNRRLELNPVATVNVKSGEVRPHGRETVSEAEQAEIAAWVEARRARLALREEEEALRLIESLNAVAQWIQQRASDAQVEALSDPILMAMHDLRAAIVRRKSDMLGES